jgi:hypothetical protein
MGEIDRALAAVPFAYDDTEAADCPSPYRELLGHRPGAYGQGSRSHHRGHSQYNLVSWALNSFGVPLDDFLPGAGP